jgi:hypothetical protein
MKILSIEPARQEPGSWVIITGENFTGRHDITFTNLDLAVPPPATVIHAGTMPGHETTQFRVRIPNEMVGGNYQVLVSGPTGVHPPSNVFTYCVGTPQYRVVFLKMHCYDETNWGGTEWGEDEIKTLWTVMADGRVWTKKSKEYSFEEGDEKPYAADDAQVLTPDGQYGEVKYGLSVVTGLYEIDDSDVATAQGYIDVAGKVAGAIVSAAGGGSLAEGAVKAITAGLKILIGWLFDDVVTVGYDSHHPYTHPGPIASFWPAAGPATNKDALQNMLVGQNQATGDLLLDFHGDGDHGWYVVSYKIMRK